MFNVWTDFATEIWGYESVHQSKPGLRAAYQRLPVNHAVRWRAGHRQGEGRAGGGEGQPGWIIRVDAPFQSHGVIVTAQAEHRWHHWQR